MRERPVPLQDGGHSGHFVFGDASANKINKITSRIIYKTKLTFIWPY